MIGVLHVADEVRPFQLKDGTVGSIRLQNLDQGSDLLQIRLSSSAVRAEFDVQSRLTFTGT